MEQLRSIPPTWHTESLLNIPLVRQAFADPNFRVVGRSIDPQWSYNKLIPLTVSGFNPLAQSYYCAATSLFAEWVKNPAVSARELNEGDLLGREVLFMAHDYLHAWAYEQMAATIQEIDVFSGDITPATLDDYVFCHLLSEAVATVGLDYWCLSKKKVNAYCPIGSTIHGLTVSYNEKDLAEYRRFNPDLKVQASDFFTSLAEFYCTGVFEGFDVADIRRSPLLLTWLRHELSYGATQRYLSRAWFSYLAGPQQFPKSHDGPLDVECKWQVDAIEKLGKQLWNEMQRLEVEGSFANSLAVRSPRPSTPKGNDIDFRFTNLNSLERGTFHPAKAWTKESYRPYLCQRIARIRYNDETAKLARFFPLLFDRCDSELEEELLGDAPCVEADASPEPHDLFIAN